MTRVGGRTMTNTRDARTSCPAHEAKRRLVGGGWWIAAAVLVVQGCGDPIRLVAKHDLGAASVSTPLVTEAFIAAGSEVGVTLVEVDGSLRCTFDAHGEVISAPKWDGTHIYFGSTNYTFFAIRPDCTEVWRFTAQDRIKSDPLVADGTVYLTSYDGHVYALSARDAERQWVFPPARSAVAAAQEEASTSVSPGREGQLGSPEEPAAPPAATSRGVIPDHVGDFSYSSPLLHEGVLYVGNLDGRIYALDAKTGALQWSYGTDGPITSSPRVFNGLLYFGSNDGNLYAVDLVTHKTRWKHSTKDWINSSPHLGEGVLYVGSNDRHLYALDAEQGSVRWSFSTKGPVIAIPTVYENLVFVAGGSGDGAIYALHAADGSSFWTYQTGGKIQSDPVVVGNKLYVTSTDHFLYVFEILRTTSK